MTENEGYSFSPPKRQPFIDFDQNPAFHKDIVPSYINPPMCYSEILEEVNHHCELHLDYEYMRKTLKTLIEQDQRISYLYDLIIYVASAYNCDDSKREKNSVQDDFDNYSKNRIKAIRLIRLLHTPTDYDQSYLEKDFQTIPEKNQKIIESLEEISMILRAFA